MGPGPVTNPSSQSKRMDTYSPPQRWGITRAAPQPRPLTDYERCARALAKCEERKVESAQEIFTRKWGRVKDALPTSSLGPIGSARRDS